MWLVSSLREAAWFTERKNITHQTIIACSNSKMETLRKVWNMFKVNNKDTRRRQWLWTHFTTFSTISIDFEQVKVCCKCKIFQKTRNWKRHLSQKIAHHLLELSTMTPLSTEKLSVGKPAIFHARILIGSPNILLSAKSWEQGIPRL